MKFYIAGPMRGRPLYNFPAFDRARDRLLGLGHEVDSPAEFDRRIGIDPDDLPADHDYSRIDNIPGFNVEEAVLRDVTAIVFCDAIYMLDGWQTSVGASAEHAVAVWLGKKIIYQNFEQD